MTEVKRHQLSKSVLSSVLIQFDLKAVEFSCRQVYKKQCHFSAVVKM